ncbi:hypothetical protein JRQ81_011359 [Phrynocephalus forsythii]|uniref:SERTA domain-containing protein n=1 Tax=Phrynocephalus forsythii TaxID=171643 RepID=A0A9Q1AQF9_9SAUR|nr:hypothetical protein JRQ81_011359 [Phrynocephalus forsythii]
MDYVRKRKAPEQEPSVAKDQRQLYKYLVQLTFSKIPFQYNNFYRLALLNSTMLRNKVMVQQEEAAQRMSQGDWEDLPESSNGAGTASSAETGKEPPSTPDACQPTAIGMGHSPDPTSIFSGQSGGPGAHDGSLVQPLISAPEETCCGTDLQADHGKGSHPDTEEPASPKADVPLAAFSEDPSPSNQEETSFLDTLPQEDLFSSVLFGSFEILAANYLSDVTSEELFADIDISEFETTPAPLPSGGGQSPPVNTEQDLQGNPQEELLYLLTQDADEREGWEYFVE